MGRFLSRDKKSRRATPEPRFLWLTLLLDVTFSSRRPHSMLWDREVPVARCFAVGWAEAFKGCLGWGELVAVQCLALFFQIRIKIL